MPLKLHEAKSVRIPNSCAARAHKLGVGEKSEQLTIKMSTSCGGVLVRCKRSRITSQTTRFDSARAFSTEVSWVGRVVGGSTKNTRLGFCHARLAVRWDCLALTRCNRERARVRWLVRRGT